MVTMAQVRALIDAHSSDDRERFKSVSLQIAADCENKGQHGFAREINRLTSSFSVLQPLPLSSSGVVSQVFPKQSFADVFLHQETRAAVDGLLSEWRLRMKLRERGLDVRRRIIFTGPPGTGKTVTAGAIAKELDVPFFIIRIDAVIDSFLGKTATNLRHAFDLVKKQEGIFLFDEFDALGRSRTDRDGSDVREMRRVVNSLLQFLEEDGLGIIIATTNLNQILDNAIWRRFEMKLQFDFPSGDHGVSITKRIFEIAKVEISKDWSWKTYSSKLGGLCHAEVETSARAIARKVVLEDLKEATMSMLEPVLAHIRKPT